MIQTKVAKAFAGAEKYYLYIDFTSLHSPLLRLASHSHTIERIRVTFKANGKREFVTRDQVFP